MRMKSQLTFLKKKKSSLLKLAKVTSYARAPLQNVLQLGRRHNFSKSGGQKICDGSNRDRVLKRAAITNVLFCCK